MNMNDNQSHNPSETQGQNQNQHPTTTAIANPTPIKPDQIELIKDVKVDLEAVIGRAEITVETLFNLKERSVVTLDAATSDPIELMLDGKVVAYGKLVAVDDQFGIEIETVS